MRPFSHSKACSEPSSLPYSMEFANSQKITSAPQPCASSAWSVQATQAPLTNCFRATCFTPRILMQSIHVPYLCKAYREQDFRHRDAIQNEVVVVRQSSLYLHG